MLVFPLSIPLYQYLNSTPLILKAKLLKIVMDNFTQFSLLISQDMGEIIALTLSYFNVQLLLCSLTVLEMTECQNLKQL